MSKNFEKFKKHYDNGFWDEERVRNVAEKGAITQEECAEILGENGMNSATT